MCYLAERITAERQGKRERDTETKRDIFDPLFHVLDGCHSLSWTSVKPEARSLQLHLGFLCGCMGPTTWPSLSALPGHRRALDGKWSRRWTTPPWIVSVTGIGFTCYATKPAPTFTSLQASKVITSNNCSFSMKLSFWPFLKDFYLKYQKSNQKLEIRRICSY